MGRVVDSRISFSGIEGKADGCHWPKGSSPAGGKASVQDITGTSRCPKSSAAGAPLGISIVLLKSKGWGMLSS